MKTSRLLTNQNSKEMAIEAKGLGKEFLLGESLPYSMLRDIIAEIPQKLLRRTPIRTKSKKFWALKNISFQVRKGEVLGLIGKNGSGKSTLLKILAKIVTPTTGKAIIRGKVASMLEVGTGFHPELTGRENIYLSGAVLGMKKTEIDLKFNKIIKFAGIEKFLDMPIKRYSSGMQVRLAFSVAANLDADVLLIDEVLAVGDVSFQRKSLKKMQNITKNEGRTVIFVSHSMPAVANLCSKVLLLDQGKIKSYGDTDKIISQYISDADKEEMKSLAYLKGRGGNGKVRITNFFIQNSQGRNVGVPECGNTYSFVFEYVTKSGKPQKDIDFGFSIKTIFDQPLLINYTSYSNQVIKRSAKKGRLIFTIPKLPLAAGTYVLSFRATAEGEEADHVDEAATFMVGEGDFYMTGNVISQNHSPMYIEGSWSLQ